MGATERLAGEGYGTFDHTGDLGLEVWAESPERLYALAAVGLMAQIAEAGDDSVEVRADLELEGDEPSDLLIHWLNTVLLKSALEHALWNRVSVRSLGPRALSATLEGSRLDPGRHVLLREVKAVSFHDLNLELEPGRCRCRLILDI